MNKRQKIIISIVGITIVLLALLGITYGYFLTRIEGNTNTNSISVTTAKLELVYGDNSAEILTGSGALMPSTDLTSAGAIGTKTFTVTNNGNDSSYVVIIDNVSIKNVSDNTDTNFLSNDFRYTLSCTKSDGTKCNEVNDLTIFPIKGGILLSNDIVEDDVHTYTLTLWYIDTGIDQSDDMGKSLQARVNIADVNQMENPFMTGVTATDNTSLAYNIIKNAKEKKNGTELTNTPLTSPAKGEGNLVYTSYTDPTSFSNTSSYTSKWYVYGTAITMDKDGYFKITNPQVGQFSSVATSMINGYITTSSGYADEESARAVMYNEFSSVYKVGASTTTSKLYYKAVTKNSENIESVLSVTTDDYGTSYYYRGGVTDNYVNFAGMCWRIVRINGDGSVKLTLESNSSTCSSSMTRDFSIGKANWGYTQGKVTNSSGEESTSDKYVGDYLNGITSTDKSMKTTLNTWFDSTFKSNGELTSAGSKVKDETWCLGNYDKLYSYSSPYSLLNSTRNDLQYAGTSFYYETGRNLYGKGVTQNATLKCNGETFNSKIGALTADEVVFAGGKAGTSNPNYYLVNSSYYWRTLSLYYFLGTSDLAFGVNGNGSVSGFNVFNNYFVRPAVSLNTGVKISSGDGTIENPYIINEG